MLALLGNASPSVSGHRHRQNHHRRRRPQSQPGTPDLGMFVAQVEVVQDGVRAVFNGRLDNEEVRRWGAAYKLVQGREFGGVSARGLEWELYWF